jgi:hypothetical protein
MEEKYRTIERIFAHKGSEVFLDRSPFGLALFGWHAPVPFFWGNTAGRDVPGNVVTLPVLQQERGWRNIGEAINGERSQEESLLVDVVPEAFSRCRDETLLFAAWVVVAKDEEDVRIAHA